MNTTTAATEADPIATLNRKIAFLEKRRELLAKLITEKQNIEQKMSAALEGEDIQLPKQGKRKESGRKQKQLALPRGVITAASFAALTKANKPLSLDEITEEVKKSPLVAGEIPDDLSRRVRGVLQSSHQFKHVGPNTFTTSSEKLRGRLFERLLKLTTEQKGEEQKS